jgi:RsiW-degrading membrane proteinase PrsW (M82 family)
MTDPSPFASTPNTHVGPGWYHDPWQVSRWRWWDGQAWTVHTADAQEHRPRLTSWLSVPVLIGVILSAPTVLLLAVVTPVAVALGLVPLVIVLPTLWWLDRVEPEPRSSRVHAILWGACVAGLVSGIVNTVVALAAGEALATVVSAPLIEELTKGLGVYWALRRREIDSVMDGIVYAGWVALGFAIIEDFTYFSIAEADAMLIQVFVLRALITPFAHPLFTSWIGLAIGLGVTRRQSIAVNAIWGYGLAVVSHAAWNGSIVFAQETGNGLALGIAALCFVALFVTAGVTVVIIRSNQQRRFLAAVPILAGRYEMTPAEVAIFGHWRQMLATRRGLPRVQRSKFDAVHAALARLALLHERPGPIDSVDEQRLSDQLRRARQALSPT